MKKFYKHLLNDDKTVFVAALFVHCQVCDDYGIIDHNLWNYTQFAKRLPAINDQW